MKTRNKRYDKSRLRILCLLTALLGIFGAGQTWAANNLTTLVVGGTSVVANGTVGETTSGEGWSYADGTLTLNNATITGTSSSDYGAAIYAAGDLTIELEGSSSATGAVHSSDMPFSGLYVSGTLTISGEGSLTVNAVESTNSSKNNYGIYAVTYIQNGGSITSKSGTGAASRGVYAYSGMTVNGGSLTATGGTATGGSTYDSSGIYVTGPITVDGVTVTAVGGSGTNSYGIYSSTDTNSLTVTGGKVTATGSSSAIYIETYLPLNSSANNHVSVTVSNSGSITAQGGAGIVLKSSQMGGSTGTGSMTVESGSTLLTNSVTVNDSPLALTGEGSWLIYGQSDQESPMHGNVTLPENVTIPSDVTVTVPEGSSLTIPNDKTLTVTNDASQLVVNGELVLEGTFSKDAKELTGTGAIVLCEITLTDDKGMDEYKDYQLKLKGKKITYTRNTTDGAYGTICLPFVPASVAGVQVTYYKVKELDGNELILGETDFEAGKPLFYQTSGAGSAITFSAENAEGVELVTEPATDSFMVGTMSEEIPTTGYFLKDNKIYPITDGAKVKVKPFRAYVKGQNDASQASVMSVNVARP